MSNGVTRTKTGPGLKSENGEILVDNVIEAPVDVYLLRWRRWAIFWVIIILIVIFVVSLMVRFSADKPVTYSDIEEHYKYGSIGAEPGPGGSMLNAVGGVLPPYWIFKVLPDMFPDELPGGYETFGFIMEEGRDMPVGVSKRQRLGFMQVGLNCAVCHTGTLRIDPDSEREIVLGMPANDLDLKGFFSFVLNATLDERFTADNVIGRVQAAGGDLGFVDRLLYRYMLVPLTQQTTMRLKGRIEEILKPDVPDWGRGRVDTFNPYKSIQFNWDLSQLPLSEITGASDYPSLWNQKPREGMELHWDGNNSSLAERNLSASLGAGVTPVTIDHERLNRVRDWIMELPAPVYPKPVDKALAAKGEALYKQQCLDCHGDHQFRNGVKLGKYLGKVTPLAEIGTDPYRLNSYTYQFAANQYGLYPDSKYRFTHFRKTDGYANHPLDGIWLRAPYLHNGSVPTLRDLLEPPENRPKTFYRGYDVYDHDKMGFISNVPAEKDHQFFYYDTAVPGNSNSGHLYGTDLADEDKDAIVEYLKTF